MKNIMLKKILFILVLVFNSCVSNNDENKIRNDSRIYTDISGLSILESYVYYSTVLDAQSINATTVKYFTNKQKGIDDSFDIMFDNGFKKDDYFRVYIDDMLYLWVSYYICDNYIYCPFNVLNIPKKTKFIGFQFNKNRIVYFLKSELTEIVVFSLKDDELLINFYDIESFKKNKKELILQVPI